MNVLGSIGICVIGLSVVGGIALAKKSADDSQQRSQQAIAFLLSSSAEQIPVNSSCHGIYGGEVPPKIKDLLAMELATLSRGKNSVLGTCNQSNRMQCTVAITHAFSESVSSADIRFEVKAGHVDMSTIDCTLTP